MRRPPRLAENDIQANPTIRPFTLHMLEGSRGSAGVYDARGIRSGAS
jgi:hypothetical protein